MIESKLNQPSNTFTSHDECFAIVKKYYPEADHVLGNKKLIMTTFDGTVPHKIRVIEFYNEDNKYGVFTKRENTTSTKYDTLIFDFTTLDAFEENIKPK